MTLLGAGTTRWMHHVRFAVCAVAAVMGLGLLSAAAASARPFTRGDVFAIGSGGIVEYSPTGKLVQTVAGTSAAGTFCFDPSGKELIVPGVGLYNSAGTPLASQWSSDTSALGTCVADGMGHVYVASGGVDSTSFAQYTLTGSLIQTFTVSSNTYPFAMDLGPDECTMYYGGFIGPSSNGIGRLNVCTGVQDSQLDPGAMIDSLSVTPNGGIISTSDHSGYYAPPSGGPGVAYEPCTQAPGCQIIAQTVREDSLDPDGTSVWICCSTQAPVPELENQVTKFDIDSGQVLAQFPIAGGAIKAYGPPLLGNADIAPVPISIPAGNAEAFLTPVGWSGQLNRLHLYADASSTGTEAMIGVYDYEGAQGSFPVMEGTITSLTPGSWNYVDVPVLSVNPGQRYWIVVVNPAGNGTLTLRGQRTGGTAELTSGQQLTSLPAAWVPANAHRLLTGAVSITGT